MICCHPRLLTIFTGQLKIICMSAVDLKKPDDPIQWCADVMGHSRKKGCFGRICLLLTFQLDRLLHQFILVKNQVTVLDLTIRRENFVVMIFNIFPGTILTSHSIRDLIMICFFVLFQSLGNAAFQIIRMCDPDNRAIRCLHKFLHSIAKHRCILLRNILERITLIIIADLYAARNRRSNNIQLLSHQSVRLIKFFFVFPVFLYEFIYASKSQDRIVPIIPAFTHGMCLKTGLSKFIGNRLKSKMKILLDCKTLSEILCTKLCFHCFAVFLKHIFIHIFAEIIRKKPIFFLFCSIV